MKMKIQFSDTPCVKVCKINSESGLCVGCFRTLDEIAQWSRFDENEKSQVYKQISTRKIRHPETMPVVDS